MDLDLPFWRVPVNEIIQYSLLLLASFTYYNVITVHPYCRMYQYFIPFLLLNDISCVAEPYFIYSFISYWTVGFVTFHSNPFSSTGFQFFAIMNNVAMNIRM